MLFEQTANGFRGLRTVLDPLLCLVAVNNDLFGIGEGVVIADFLYESTVTGCAGTATTIR